MDGNINLTFKYLHESQYFSLIINFVMTFRFRLHINEKHTAHTKKTSLANISNLKSNSHP